MADRYFRIILNIFNLGRSLLELIGGKNGKLFLLAACTIIFGLHTTEVNEALCGLIVWYSKPWNIGTLYVVYFTEAFLKA